MTAAPISNAPAPEKISRLGKGLSAIFADEDPNAPDASGQPRTLPIERIYPSKNQPRKNFDEAALEELANSIKEKGVLQPILVRPHPDKPNGYEIVAGERRWRASQRAQLHEIPVIIRDIKDKEALEYGLIENIQRDDLTPMEESETFQRLLDEYGHQQDELAQALGKSRAYVNNMLRLNQLPDTVKELVRQNTLTAGHARALLSAKNPLMLANEVIKGGLSVRQTENLAKLSHSDKPAATESRIAMPTAARKGSARARARNTATKQQDADIVHLERDVSSWLGLKVKLFPKGSGGKLAIEYQTLDQLEDVLKRLSKKP
jgi:ParB family chromosome partitioning protein